MCWCGVLRMLCRNAATCVRISWFLLAFVLSKCMEVKSIVVVPSVAACRSLARTVRACQANLCVCDFGAKDIV